MKIPAAKAAVDKEWENLEKNSAYDESATNCVEIEFTLWFASSINPRVKVMLGNHHVSRKATEKTCNSTVDHKWSTSFCNQAAEHNTR